MRAAVHLRPSAPVLAVVAAAALFAAVALLGACGSTSSSGTGYAGYWQSAPGSQLGGMLLIRIDRRGPGYAIVGLNFLGAAADRAAKVGSALVVQGTGAKNRGYQARFVLTGADRLTVSLVRTGQAGAPVLSLKMVRAAGSSAQLAAALAAELRQARILKVEQGVRTLQAGLRAWAAGHGGTYPPVALVRPGGAFARAYVGRKLKQSWPNDPYTGGTMQPGPGPGDFTYTVTADGRHYTLAAHFPQGADYVVP